MATIHLIGIIVAAILYFPAIIKQLCSDDSIDGFAVYGIVGLFYCYLWPLTLPATLVWLVMDKLGKC
jgi:ammonia channel protein AmtB